MNKLTAASKLMIEFGRSSLSITDLRRSKTRHFDCPDGQLEIANTESVGSLLRNALKEMSVSVPTAATICIPRSAGCIHFLEVPRVSDGELPAIVDLEMEAIYGEEVQQQEWDYTPLDLGAGAATVTIVVFATSKQYTASLRAVLEAAKVSPRHITLVESNYSSALSSNDALSHIVAVKAGRLETLLCWQQTVVQSQSVSVDLNQPCQFDSLLGTFRRMNASLPGALRELNCTHLLMKPEGSELASNLEGSVYEKSLVEAAQEAGFEVIEPARSKSLLTYRRGNKRMIDLENPTRPPAPGVSSRTKAVVAATAIGLLAAAYWGYLQHQAHLVAGEIKAVRQQVAEYDQQFAILEPDLEAAAEFKRWQDANVRWDKQIVSISKHFSESKDLYVVRMQMDNQSRTQRNPVTRVEGRATSPNSVLALTRGLVSENPSLSIQPNGIEPNSVDQQFESQFRVEISEADTSRSKSNPTSEEA